VLTDAELALMGLLAEQPSHGYDLERVIQERGVRNWTAIGHSSIYYLLRKLAARGLLEVVGAKPAPRTRATYRLSEHGARTMRQAALEAIAMPTPRHDRVLPGIAVTPMLDPDVVVRSLSVRRRALEADLAGIEAAQSALGEVPTPAERLFDYGETMIRAELGWIERTVAAVRRDASAPGAPAPDASAPARPA
jgi:DNA-binding PadR family transcriptional regulator